MINEKHFDILLEKGTIFVNDRDFYLAFKAELKVRGIKINTRKIGHYAYCISLYKAGSVISL